MKKRSKRYQAAVKAAGDLAQPKTIADAASLVLKLATAKFAESIDLSVHLNLDTKKADQQFRGSFSMPHGTGRTLRVIVFCDDADKTKLALDAGAVKAGGEDLVNAVNDGFMDFDVAVATPKMMRFVGKLGKVLGPRGLMPSPKSGTVTDDVGSAVKEFKAGKIEYRTDAQGNVHVRVGTSKFSADQLAANINAFMSHVADHRPSSVKGEFIRHAAVSSTMGPGIALVIQRAQEA